MRASIPLALLWTSVTAASVVGCGSSDDDANANDANDAGASSSPETGTSSGVTPDGSSAPPGDATTVEDTGAGGDAGAGGDERGALPDAAPEAGADATTGAACSGTPDCKVVADYCGACTCVALGAGESLPACTTTPVSCIVDPCGGRSATCGASGTCGVSP
jgi:hypothetical protein